MILQLLQPESGRKFSCAGSQEETGGWNRRSCWEYFGAVMSSAAIFGAEEALSLPLRFWSERPDRVPSLEDGEEAALLFGSVSNLTAIHLPLKVVPVLPVLVPDWRERPRSHCSRHSVLMFHF